MKELNKVIQINTALSNKPFFINVSNLDNPSIDTVINEAVSSLEAQGRPLEAQQLTQLYESHQLYNGNQTRAKGDLFTDLATVRKTVGEQDVEIAELTLMTSHAGGL